MDYLTFFGGYAIMNQRKTKQNTNLMGVCVYVNRTENLRNGTVVSHPGTGKKAESYGSYADTDFAPTISVKWTNA